MADRLRQENSQFDMAFTLAQATLARERRRATNLRIQTGEARQAAAIATGVERKTTQRVAQQQNADKAALNEQQQTLKTTQASVLQFEVSRMSRNPSAVNFEAASQAASQVSSRRTSRQPSRTASVVGAVVGADAFAATGSAVAGADGLGAQVSAISEGAFDEPFLTGSRYVDVDHDVWRLAIDARDERTDVFATAEAIMTFVNTNWLYQANATSASTHMSEVMKDRRGVCQDFSHVMIGMCRALGIPARYVSGYLYNGPTSHLRGAQASHAWCEVWMPGRGWFGLDPTNNTLADERYIKIATGRDYDDAAPIRGSFSGAPGATAALEVTVEVELV
jgi:transglutaminase-like putative cysteine protease